MNQTIAITKRGVDRVRSGHLWIYRSDIAKSRGVVGGSVVRVEDERGRFIAMAMFSDRSEISLRLLSLKEEKIDRDWWRAKIVAAANRREGLHDDSNAYRLIHSEGDLLPSLIADVYDDVFVLQTLSQTSDALKQTIVEIVNDLFAPRSIVERNDVKVRALEGLELRTGILSGDDPGEFEIRQNGIRFLVSPLSGQKTGSFLDQRENQRTAASYGRGRALDCFTFSGGFALNLAGVCETVLGLDISGDAISAARLNAELNDIKNVEFMEVNVFDALNEFERQGRRFETIVLDPPAFAKNRASVKAALRGYKEINFRALKLLETGGVLITCTCSYHLSEAMFLEVIEDAARDAGKRVQLMEKRMQSRDHPVLLSMPETFYLKCLILRVIA